MYTGPMRWQAIWMVVLASGSFLVSGCAGNYCQSGPKDGTRCYDAPSSQQSEPTGAYAAQDSSTTSPQRTPSTTPR
jgi:hypothetical protein